MKKSILLIIVFSFWCSTGIMAQGDVSVPFSLCTGNVPACNPFYPQYTCNNISMRTMYGAPKLIDYTWTNFGNPTTTRVVRLTGTRQVNNGVVQNTDEGFEFDYVFKPYRNYRIVVRASGYRDNNGMTVIAKGQVILGYQNSSQTVGTSCGPEVFDFMKNNGEIVLTFTPNSFDPSNFEVIYSTTQATLAKFKIRCINTASDAIVPNSYLVIHSISIVEGVTNGNDNACGVQHNQFANDLTWDYSQYVPGTPNYGAPYGSWYSTTAFAHFNISNGTYSFISNRDIYFKPGFRTTLGPNGNIRAVIGKCNSGDPFRTGPTPQSSISNSEETAPISTGDRKVILYPNPVSTVMNVQLKEDTPLTQLFVTDNLGRKLPVRMNKISRYKISLEASTLQTGIYYLTIVNKLSIETYKFVVSR